jgi:hypothetical protein
MPEYSYYPTYAEVLHGYNQSAKIPVFMGGANFESETNGDKDGGSPHILRLQEYWTMLSGAAGQLYGNRYIWRFLPGWQTNLATVGVIQFGYMQRLFAARKWYNLAPDQQHPFVTARWFDPSANTFQPIAGSPPANTGAQQFTTPGKNNDDEPDWLLVLETAPK